MLGSITFIKTVHTLVFFGLTVANLIVFYYAVTGRTSVLLWVSLVLVAIEGVVLVANGWKCPLRIYAERLGAEDGSVTDIFLPKWLAERIFPICGGLLALSALIFLLRLAVR